MNKPIRDQRGFGLLDVLLGMMIIGLLLVIGVANVSRIIDRGHVQSAESEALKIGQAIESFVTENYMAPPANQNSSATPTPNLPASSSTFPDWDMHLSQASATNLRGLGIERDPTMTVRFYQRLGISASAVNGDGNYSFCAVKEIQSGSKYAWALYDSRDGEVTAGGITSALPTSSQCVPA